MNIKGYLFQEHNPELQDGLDCDFETTPKYLVISITDSATKKKVLNLVNTYNSGSVKYSFAIWGSRKTTLNVRVNVRGSFLGKIKTPELLLDETVWMPLEFTLNVKPQKYKFIADSGPSKGQTVRGVHLFLNSIEALIVNSFI